MADLPTGTVTMLFSDIEGSTRLLQQQGERYGSLLDEYRALLRSVFVRYSGHEVDTQGDSFFVVFPRAADAVAAAVAAQQALAAHPWPEDVAFRTRMGVHTGEPRRGAAGYVGLDVHRAARLMAAGHGGQVLLSDATRALVEHDLPPGVELRDLGAHRLKDLRHPEHIFHLVISDLPSAFPLLKTLDARPNNLPVQSTPFIGREPEVAAVRQRLLDPDVRLVTLTGPGGTGKTRLAVQIAAEVLDDFADGVFFVDLTPISDPALVAPMIAKTLGIDESGEQPLIEPLKAYVRAKQLLLVLDNFEQVVAAGSLVDDLLRAAPGLEVLVTSRVVLGVYGEHTMEVPPLALPDLTHLPPLDQLSQYEAVRLFIERAQAARADFQVTNETAPAVAEICHRLDGLPLAIELAAARIRLLPLPALLQRLTQRVPSRLQMLTGGARTLPARQRTLRDAIAWSYDLLDPEEQMLFRRLGVFVGGWTVEAAEAVAGGQGSGVGQQGTEAALPPAPDLRLPTTDIDVLDGLASLVDKSLIRRIDSFVSILKPIIQNPQESRFGMLETIREYALEQLAASGEAEVLRRRHARHYLALMETVQSQDALRDQLSAETDNILAALRWTLEQGEVELGPQLVEAAFEFWWVPGLWSAVDLWIQALHAWRDRLPSLLRAKVLTRLGHYAWYQHAHPQALPLLEKGLALVRELGDKAGIADALHRLADVVCDQGDYARAEELYRESLARFQELGDQRGSGWLYRSWGEMALEQGDAARALALEQASLALFRELGEVKGTAIALLDLGFVAQQQGDDGRATELCRESLLLARTLDNPWLSSLCLVGFARVAAAQGQQRLAGSQHAERAARLLGAVEACYASSGYHPYRAAGLEYDHALAAARAQLDDATWAAAWAEGRAMALEQAIAYALAEGE